MPDFKTAIIANWFTNLKVENVFPLKYVKITYLKYRKECQWSN